LCGNEAHTVEAPDFSPGERAFRPAENAQPR
jgi:hypothetical protein